LRNIGINMQDSRYVQLSNLDRLETESRNRSVEQLTQEEIEMLLNYIDYVPV